MCSMQSVLWLLASFMGLAHSWDIAVSHGDVLEFYTNKTKINTVRFDSHNLAALTYDEVHNWILYVDKQANNDTICGYDISSKVDQCFIERNGRNIHGLAFDPATELLFFSDTNERSINWISLKSGSNNNIYGYLLTKLDHGIPTDIAIDSCGGFIYWINTNLATPIIEKSRLNGSNREVVINIKSFSINTTYILNPHSLTIDQKTKKMYWIEPKSSANYDIHYTDLNGKNDNPYVNIEGNGGGNPLSNTLTLSKTSLFWVFWDNDKIRVEILGKIKWTEKENVELHTKNVTVGIVANYKIKERIQGITDCEALTTVERKNCDVPFCVHGMKVIGQSICKCSPGYIGERCDVTVCENYCIQGNCNVNDEGLPECSCNAGYSGDRCEVNACYGYCLNDGVCSLNEEDEPSCECVGNHEGSRCEVVQTVTFTFTNTPTFSADTNLTLTDFLSNWRKPKILVVGDEA